MQDVILRAMIRVWRRCRIADAQLPQARRMAYCVTWRPPSLNSRFLNIGYSNRRVLSAERYEYRTRIAETQQLLNMRIRFTGKEATSGASSKWKFSRRGVVPVSVISARPLLREAGICERLNAGESSRSLMCGDLHQAPALVCDV